MRDLGWVDEHRLGEVHLARELLEPLLGQRPRVGEDGELVPGQRRVGEDVRDDVAVPGHEPSLRTRAYPGRVRLYLVRHAEAAPGEPDDLRSLTSRGAHGRARPRHAARRRGSACGRGALEPAAACARDRDRDREGARVRSRDGRAAWRPARQPRRCVRPSLDAATRSSSSATSPTAAGSPRSSRAAPSRRSRPPGSSSSTSDAGRRRQRAAEVVRLVRGAARHRLRDRGGRGLRAARPERRGQDDDGRDPRGLPQARRRLGRGARRGPPARRLRLARAHRRSSSSPRRCTRT